MLYDGSSERVDRICDLVESGSEVLLMGDDNTPRRAVLRGLRAASKPAGLVVHAGGLGWFLKVWFGSLGTTKASAGSAHPAARESP
jgi:hypothetical protein